MTASLTGLAATDIDILVTTGSAFHPGRPYVCHTSRTSLTQVWRSRSLPLALTPYSWSLPLAQRSTCGLDPGTHIQHAESLACQTCRTMCSVIVSVCPAVPCLGSMLVNAFKMQPDVKTVHMGCMACSAGALGINLV